MSTILKHWIIDFDNRRIENRTLEADIVQGVVMNGDLWEEDTPAVREAWTELSDQGIIPSIEEYIKDLEESL